MVGGIAMSVSYKKLWVMLAEKGWSKVDLRKNANITPGILTNWIKTRLCLSQCL